MIENGHISDPVYMFKRHYELKHLVLACITQNKKRTFDMVESFLEIENPNDIYEKKAKRKKLNYKSNRKGKGIESALVCLYIILVSIFIFLFT